MFKSTPNIIKSLQFHSLAESQKIKIVLYHELFRTKHVVIPEVSIGNRVADMLVLNSDIHIIEIKSDRDKLVRLAHQIQAYRKSANCVSVAVQDKFLPTALYDKDLDGIGVYHIDSKYKLHQARKPKHNQILKQDYFRYWCSEEVRGTLHGFKNISKLTIDELKEVLLKHLTIEELKKLTMFRMREKYFEEYAKRIQALDTGNLKETLKTRFGNTAPLKITPLAQIPCGVFINFFNR